MKHWVFDLDGTLVDSSGHYDLSIQATLDKFKGGYTTDEVKLAHRYFNPVEYFVLFFPEDFVLREIIPFFMEHNCSFVNETECFPQIIDLLSFLKSKDVTISVWTGRDTKSAKEILKHSGIEQFVSYCVGRCCVEKSKPYPDGLLKVLSGSKNHGDEVFMIGDHVYDMQGARAAGVKGLSVNWNNRFNENIESLSFRHFTSVPELILWTQNYYNRIY